MDDGAERSTQETVDAVAKELRLTDADLAEAMPSGKAPLITNRLAWAKLHLKRAGLLDSPRRGIYRITERGLQVVHEAPAVVNLAYLSRYPEYVKFRNRRHNSEADAAASTPESVADAEPETIYIQAKSWQAAAGRPEIQRFAGALQGQRARKGVFITTSDFTKEAGSYAASIQSTIVRVNGTQLAELMIDHGIGVTRENAYEIKRLDSDYFDPE
jgi:restriction endonuclease Mrr